MNKKLCLEETMEALAIGLSDVKESTLLFTVLRIDGDDDRGKDLNMVFSRQPECTQPKFGRSYPMSVYFEISSGSYSASSIKSMILTSLFQNEVNNWPAQISELLMHISEIEQYGNPTFSIVNASSIKGSVRCVGKDNVDPARSMYKVEFSA